MSLEGFAALVPRALAVRVDCLNERGEAVVLQARGWYARILQHEIDHLNGVIYIDRMLSRSFMSIENLTKHWSDKTFSHLQAGLEPARSGTALHLAAASAVFTLRRKHATVAGV